MLEAPAPSAGRATHAPSRRAAWTASCLAVLLLASGLTLGLPQRSGFDVQVFFLVVMVLGFATIGQLIALSPTPSPIRWIYLGVAVCAGLAALAGALASEWLEGGPVPRVVGLAGALYAELAWITWVLVPTTFLLLLFPTGRLPSRRWLPVAACAVAGLGGLAAGSMLTPGPIPDFPSVENPLGVPLPTWAESVASVLLILAVLGSAASLVVRFRRSGGVERQQIKWLAYGGAVAAPTVLLATFAYDAIGEDLANAVIQLAVLSVPFGAGVAILRHRLYDIDLVINRTLVYATLTATLAAAYLGTVLLLQYLLQEVTAGSDLSVAGSTLAVAALFRPMRARIQRGVDRRFYRSRYDAVRTVAAFTADLRDRVDLDEIAQGLHQAAVETMQPTHVSVWLRTDTP